MIKTDFKQAAEYTAPTCKKINLMPRTGYLQNVSGGTIDGADEEDWGTL